MRINLRLRSKDIKLVLLPWDILDTGASFLDISATFLGVPVWLFHSLTKTNSTVFNTREATRLCSTEQYRNGTRIHRFWRNFCPYSVNHLRKPRLTKSSFFSVLHQWTLCTARWKLKQPKYITKRKCPERSCPKRRREGGGRESGRALLWLIQRSPSYGENLKQNQKKPKLALSYPSFSFYFSFHSVHFSALK